MLFLWNTVQNYSSLRRLQSFNFKVHRHHHTCRISTLGHVHYVFTSQKPCCHPLTSKLVTKPSIGIIYLNAPRAISVPSCGWNLKTPARITIFQTNSESEIRKLHYQYVIDWEKYLGGSKGAANAPTPMNYELCQCWVGPNAACMKPCLYSESFKKVAKPFADIVNGRNDFNGHYFIRGAMQGDSGEGSLSSQI